MIFIDSTVLIDYFNGINSIQTKKLSDILGNELVAIGDIVLAEVLQGFRNDKDYNIAKRILLSFPCYNICGVDIAIKSADNFRFLRKKGVTVRKTIDIIIGTFCIENEFLLLHNDKDFKPMERYLGLKTL
jgi:hypothetical protein